MRQTLPLPDQIIADVAADPQLSCARRWPALLVTTYERAPPRLFLLADGWWLWVIDSLPIAGSRWLALRWAGEPAVARAHSAPARDTGWSGWPGTLMFLLVWSAVAGVLFLV